MTNLEFYKDEILKETKESDNLVCAICEKKNKRCLDLEDLDCPFEKDLFSWLLEEYKEPIMKGKVMISQPMAGKSKEEIVNTRERAVEFLEDKGYKVVDTLFSDILDNDKNTKSRDDVNIPLYFLAKALEKMSSCDTVYFCKGWENARGCRIEHFAAFGYGLQIIYED